jgi:hypothetical protein
LIVEDHGAQITIGTVSPIPHISFTSRTFESLCHYISSSANKVGVVRQLLAMAEVVALLKNVYRNCNICNIVYQYFQTNKPIHPCLSVYLEWTLLAQLGHANIHIHSCKHTF